MSKFFRAFKEKRALRKQYRIKFRIRFSVDNESYIFALIPTILFILWPFRSLETPIFQFAWLNFGLAIGEWDIRK